MFCGEIRLKVSWLGNLGNHVQTHQWVCNFCRKVYGTVDICADELGVGVVGGRGVGRQHSNRNHLFTLFLFHRHWLLFLSRNKSLVT